MTPDRENMRMKTWWAYSDQLSCYDAAPFMTSGTTSQRIPVVKLAVVEAHLRNVASDCSEHTQDLARSQIRLQEAETILRELDGHPRADYPVSLDKRIKAWLAAEPKEGVE